MNFIADRLVVNPASDAVWDLGSFRMLAQSRSAAGHLGGDFYAFRLRSADKLSVIIGDACGRGEEGARLLPGVLARVEQLAAAWTKPSHFLDALNRGLAGELSSDRFVTASALEIDARAGTLTVANAGHVPVVLRRASGKATLVGRASGPPLGILRDSSYFDETYRLSPSDLLVLVTDGIVEAVETDLTEMPKLKAWVEQTRGGGDAVYHRLLEQLCLEQGKRGPDDMTLLSLEFLPESRGPIRCETSHAA